MIAAILLMAGTGERFGSDLPKQFHRLGNKKVYQWPLETLDATHLFDEIILVCPFEYIEAVRQEVAAKFKIIEGGATRQESSYRGLAALNHGTKIVLIHDAVRPLVSEKIIRENIEKARIYDAVDTCIPSTDTIVHSEDGKSISAIPKRSAYWLGQTPQTFAYSLIYRAHKETKRKGATDDCSLVLDLDKSVHIIQGDINNFKITDKKDLEFAKFLTHINY